MKLDDGHVLSGRFKLDYPDQDALNKVAEGRVQILPAKWNLMYSLLSILRTRGTSIPIPDDAVFLHFGGALKPWHGWSHLQARTLFLRHQSNSGWSDVPLDMPRTYKQMHQCSHFHFHQRRYLSALGWYLRYLRSKTVHMGEKVRLRRAA
ncbi:glycosyltransferase family 8 C-terminal domain-containing protein [Herbaspirillum lusitanum]|uniref:Glycosyltransferase family 8 C-terminal domain-containing protein n=1 Tax=Herbaspirillum lusitanum TaxID=213312 RepID=A0ABW9A576_9BURK